MQNILNVKRTKLYAIRRSEELPYIDLQGTILFDLDDVYAYMDEQKRKTVSALCPRS